MYGIFPVAYHMCVCVCVRGTQVHELCHAATWVIDHIDNPPHGAAFKRWGARAAKVRVHVLAK